MSDRNLTPSTGDRIPPSESSTGGRRRAVTPPPTPPAQYTPPKLQTSPHPDVTKRVRRNTTTVQLSGKAENDNGVPFAFGTVELTGSIRYAFRSGSDLFIVRALALGARSTTLLGGEAAGEIDSLLSLKSDNGIDGMVAGNFQYWFYTGSLTQTVNPVLAASDGSWNETMVLTDPLTGEQRGICYAIERYINWTTVWQKLGGVPPWRYRVKGSKLYDPRTGVTAYTENLFLQWRYWALDPEGRYLPAAAINNASFNAAANIADQALGSGKRYETHMVLETGTTDDWLKMFRLLGDAYWFERDGQWNVLVDRPSAAVASYSDLHYTLARETELGPPADVDQIINKVTIEYTETSGTKWRTESISLAMPGVAAGSEAEIPATYKMPEIHNRAMAETKLRYLLYGAQDDQRLLLNWRPNTGERQLGDVVTQAVTERGLTADWRVFQRELLPDGTYNVELQLMSARKYSDTTSTVPAKIDSTQPDPFGVPSTPTGLTLTPLTGARLLIAWNAITWPFFVIYRVTVQRTGGSEYVLADNLVQPGPVQLEAIDSSSTYTVKVYAIVQASGATSTALAGTFTLGSPALCYPQIHQDMQSSGLRIGQTSAVVSWVNRSRRKLATSGVTWGGPSLGSFDATKVCNGDTSSVAFTAGNSGVLTLYSPTPIAPREVMIHLSGHSSTAPGSGIPFYAIDMVQFSDDGVSYATQFTSQNYADLQDHSKGGDAIPRILQQFDDSLFLPHSYWKFRFHTAFGVIASPYSVTEFQLYDYAGPEAFIESVNVYSLSDGVPSLIANVPIATGTLDVTQQLRRELTSAYYNNLMRVAIRLRAVNVAGQESDPIDSYACELYDGATVAVSAPVNAANAIALTNKTIDAAYNSITLASTNLSDSSDLARLSALANTFTGSTLQLVKNFAGSFVNIISSNTSGTGSASIGAIAGDGTNSSGDAYLVTKVSKTAPGWWGMGGFGGSTNWVLRNLASSTNVLTITTAGAATFAGSIAATSGSFSAAVTITPSTAVTGLTIVPNGGAIGIEINDGTRNLRLGGDATGNYVAGISNHSLRFLTNSAVRLTFDAAGTSATFAVPVTITSGTAPQLTVASGGGASPTRLYLTGAFNGGATPGTIDFVETAASTMIARFRVGAELSNGWGGYGIFLNDSGGLLERFHIDPRGNVGFTGAGVATSFGSGQGVIFFANAAVVPSSNPVGGPVMYGQGGAIKGRGTSGTITTMANAEPHCAVCDGDVLVFEAVNHAHGYARVCLRCMIDDLGLANKPYVVLDEDPTLRPRKRKGQQLDDAISTARKEAAAARIAAKHTPEKEGTIES